MKMKNDSYQNGRITERTVAKNEIDELGHVNNAEYVKWIQAAATEHWFAIAPAELIEKYVWFCSRHEIDYKQQLFIDDLVEIRTWLGSTKGARFDRFIDIRGKGSEKPAVMARTTWVLIDREMQRPVRVQPEILKIFR